MKRSVEDQLHDQGITLDKLLLTVERNEELLRKLLRRREVDAFTLRGSRGRVGQSEEDANGEGSQEVRGRHAALDPR